MSSTTSRAAFYKPAGGENVNVTTDLNNNLDKLDTNLNFRVVASAAARNAISPHWAGLNVRQTDDGTCWVSNGSSPISGSWDQIATSSTYGSALNISTSATGNIPFNLRVGSEANNKFHVRGDGATFWGAGGATAVDTNLYRSAANTLKTDDNLIVALNSTVTGNSAIGGNETVTGNHTVTGNLAVGGIGQVQYVATTSDATWTNNATLSNVTNMVFPVVASGVYTVTATLFTNCTVNDSGDLKISFTGPTGVAFDIAATGANLTSLGSGSSASGEWLARVNMASAGATMAFGTSTTTMGITLSFRVVVSSTAGNIQLQAAQSSATVNTSRILARSFMTATRVA